MAGFEAQQETISQNLPCLREPIRPSVAGRVHRLRGLGLFLAGDETQAVAAFAAARAADGSMDLAGLVPPGHALEKAFVRGTTDGPVDRVPAPERGELYLDGERSLERASDRPVVAQWVINERPRFTRWVPAGLALPTYPEAKIAPETPITDGTGTGGDAGAKRGKGRRKAGSVMLLAGAGSGAAAGLLYGAAGASRLDFDSDHPEWNRTDLSRARQRTNNLATASAATGAAALGLTSVGLVMQW